MVDVAAGNGGGKESHMRRLRRRLGRPVRSALWRWRSSLQVRVVTTSFVVGIVVVSALGAFLSNAMRNGIFEQRVDQISQETASSTQKAQETLASSPPSMSASDAQSMLYQLLGTLRYGGSLPRQVFLWSERGGPSAVIDVGSSLDTLITPQMRAETVKADGGQVMQSVAIPKTSDQSSSTEPGLVVGTTIEVPGAGPFELYYLYDLSADQKTLDFLQSVIVAGLFVLVILLVLITGLIARQVVSPVRAASRVAVRLSDGHLDERMPVKGHDEIATLAKSFNEMAESLSDQIGRMEQMSALQRRFVSDVSHELRTPLTTVRMAGDMLYENREDYDAIARRSVELLQAQLDRFEELLADLLEISRFDAGAAVLDAEQRDVREVISSVIEYVAPLADRKQVWLSVSLPAKPVVADIDPRRIERIVRNLLVNAIEHAEGRPVRVRMKADARAVAVVVRDFGVGMTEAETGHVFDRFWRADPARARTTGGTGLGLAISLEDARLHGGWLEVWSRPGRGASFRLTVPRRAGIQLASSPLPLVSEADTAVLRALTGQAQVPALPPVQVDDLGPAALPDVVLVMPGSTSRESGRSGQNADGGKAS